MSEEQNNTPAEERALNELGASFNALLARTPEPGRRWNPNRKSLLGGAVAVAALLVLAWAVAWPDSSRLTVDDALASVADVAADQPTPGPTQFIESESTVTTVTRAGSGSTLPPGIEPNELYTINVFRHAWLSMTLPGVVGTRLYSEGSEGSQERISSSSARPAPVYRIGGVNYEPREIAEFAKNPSSLMRQIDAAVGEVPAEFRPETKWRYLVEPLQAMTPPLPSVLRAELIRGLESIPGGAEPTERRDPQSRRGVQYELVDAGLAYHAMFDPSSSELLYSEVVVDANGAGPFPNAKRGQVLHSYLLRSSAVANSVPEN